MAQIIKSGSKKKKPYKTEVRLPEQKGKRDSIKSLSKKDMKDSIPMYGKYKVKPIPLALGKRIKDWKGIV
jgi:hypothetical protein